MDTKIVSNHHVYHARYYHELSPKQKRRVDYRYWGTIDLEEAEFCFYRGNPYYMGDCMRLERNTMFKEWDGYFDDTMFSIILVKYLPDDDGYKFGIAYS